jgi:hypothetical protein
MKKQNVRLILSFIVLSLIFTSCSSGNRISGGSSKKCGCGVNRGYVGY